MDYGQIFGYGMAAAGIYGMYRLVQYLRAKRAAERDFVSGTSAGKSNRTKKH